MRSLRRRVLEHNVHAWADAFLQQLRTSSRQSRSMRRSGGLDDLYPALSPRFVNTSGSACCLTTTGRWCRSLDLPSWRLLMTNC